MAITLSTGVSLQVAKTYGASVNTTAVSNATTAVVTTGSAHSISVGDYVEVTSGWGLLDKRVVRRLWHQYRNQIAAMRKNRK